jgi:hypothetical protein
MSYLGETLYTTSMKNHLHGAQDALPLFCEVAQRTAGNAPLNVALENVEA